MLTTRKADRDPRRFAQATTVLDGRAMPGDVAADQGFPAGQVSFDIEP
jgi:hypothetical protein